MKKELNILYLELLKYPNSPKSYRNLVSYYDSKESLAFQELLKIRFQDDYYPNIDQEQRKNH
jgi:hypothetical protein